MIFQGSQDKATNTDGEPSEAIDQIKYNTTNRDNNNDPTPETALKRKKLTKNKVKQVAGFIQQLNSLGNILFWEKVLPFNLSSYFLVKIHFNASLIGTDWLLLKNRTKLLH